MGINDCRLWLANGREFAGWAPPDQEGASGEIVFTTGMTGYVESLTDPSYAGQILVFTYPLIGNYGVPPKHQWESQKIQVAGVVMGALCEQGSHYQSTCELTKWLQAKQIPWISGVDTRAVTKELRSHGSTLGAIGSDSQPSLVDPNKTDLVPNVSPQSVVRYEKPEARHTVVAIDCGMKEGILQCLCDLPLNVICVPYNYDLSNLQWDGLFLSNGPGDPSRCPDVVTSIQQAMKTQKPIFGICLGTQLLARAAGAETYKLPFGHRGQNQPVKELATGRCMITSQNHGYAVAADTLPKGWTVTFSNLNDGSVEGIAHEELPFQAVQFHPEAKPGPLDAQWLFDQFREML